MDEFPSEAFVQKSVERYFKNQGFSILEKIPYLDVHAKKEDEEWRVECKGKTSVIGLDLDTGIGQILRRMNDENANYAVAIPDIPGFRNATARLPKRVRRILNLHWIWVKENGEVEIEKCSERA